jgi:hypothetical protein
VKKGDPCSFKTSWRDTESCPCTNQDSSENRNSTINIDTQKEIYYDGSAYGIMEAKFHELLSIS